MVKKYIIYFVILIFIAWYMHTSVIYSRNAIENFKNACNDSSGYIEHFDNNIKEKFDQIYVKLHNITFQNKKLCSYIINQIDQKTIKNKWNKKNINILESGCGTGTTYSYLYNKYKNVIGIDQSNEFLKCSKITTPTGNFIHGNLLESKLFDPAYFSHILCLFDTIYHNEDHKTILMNFKYWLKPKGILAITIYDKDLLDPAPRDYSQYFKDKQGVKHSLTYFDEFTHDAWWNNSTATSIEYHEKYVLENKKKKINTHKLFIPNKKTMIKKITDCGFKLTYIIDFKYLGINDQEIFIFSLK
jgi:ubiquinone/menaquinone biosynthesis C-methylase UbiE